MIGLVRLAICVTGVYATFLLWAIAQERLVSHPFPSINHPTRLQPTTSDGSRGGDRFPSPIFLTFVQAVASSICAFAYLVFGAWQDGSLRYKTKMDIIGWNYILSNARQSRAVRVVSTPGMMNKDKMEYPEVPTGDHGLTNEKTNGDFRLHDGELKGRGSRLQTPLTDVQTDKNAVNRSEREKTFVDLGVSRTPWRKTLLGLVLQVAVFQTTAGPIGFLALEHISYPTMVLGKSCKLIPVLLLNVLIYRRSFSVHKYIVVGLVTIGISLFMLLGDKKKKGGSDSLWGLTLLIINLLIDGLTNSTQDQIFSTYRQFTGQQMMFTMAILTQVLLFPFLIMPLPVQPLSILHHLPIPLATHLTPSVSGAEILFARPAMRESIAFLLSHPTAFKPLIAFASLGGLGQLFIFETIQHFGSLTLVMVTVTRKLFTMLLSVFVFHHTLTKGQWLGVVVVFLGIGVEAGIKRLDVLKRARRDNR